jgi:hypothetical protein
MAYLYTNKNPKLILLLFLSITITHSHSQDYYLPSEDRQWQLKIK